MVYVLGVVSTIALETDQRCLAHVKDTLKRKTR